MVGYTQNVKELPDGSIIFKVWFTPLDDIYCEFKPTKTGFELNEITEETFKNKWKTCEDYSISRVNVAKGLCAKTGLVYEDRYTADCFVANRTYENGILLVTFSLFDSKDEEGVAIFNCLLNLYGHSCLWMYNA